MSDNGPFSEYLNDLRIDPRRQAGLPQPNPERDLFDLESEIQQEREATERWEDDIAVVKDQNRRAEQETAANQPVLGPNGRWFQPGENGAFEETPDIFGLPGVQNPKFPKTKYIDLPDSPELKGAFGGGVPAGALPPLVPPKVFIPPAPAPPAPPAKMPKVNPFGP
tara:strand:+ start:474 stop:971 length:498 start_codon:yes stop_codon:yes gene_type:complete